MPPIIAAKVCSALGMEKKTNLTVSFFLFFNKQKIEHQSESNSVTSWTASL
jgi:hypothetical protein